MGRHCRLRMKGEYGQMEYRLAEKTLESFTGKSGMPRKILSSMQGRHGKSSAQVQLTLIKKLSGTRYPQRGRTAFPKKPIKGLRRRYQQAVSALRVARGSVRALRSIFRERKKLYSQMAPLRRWVSGRLRRFARHCLCGLPVLRRLL